MEGEGGVRPHGPTWGWVRDKEARPFHHRREKDEKPSFSIKEEVNMAREKKNLKKR